MSLNEYRYDICLLRYWVESKVSANPLTKPAKFSFYNNFAIISYLQKSIFALNDGIKI